MTVVHPEPPPRRLARVELEALHGIFPDLRTPTLDAYFGLEQQ